MIDQSDILQRMREELSRVGLVVEQVQADGVLHRCGVKDKARGTDGSYKAFLDVPASLWWKNWRTDEDGTWCAKNGREMTAEEREAWRERAWQIKAEREQETAERHRVAAEKAVRIWESLPSAGENNAYLKNKGVLPFGELRETKDGKLVIPVRHGEGGLLSLQFVDGGGDKRFLSGGELKACFCPLPAKDGDKSGPLLIAEGYATAASLRMATGFAVLSAFNAGNLCPVAEMAREKYPDREIVICADNDLTNTKPDGTPCNPGREKAEEAAHSVGAKLALCPSVGGQEYGLQRSASGHG